MKRISQFFGLIAVLFAVTAAFAFKPAAKPVAKSVTGEVWFYFVGNPGEEGDITKYVRVNSEGEGSPECDPGSHRCAILILPDAMNSSAPDATEFGNSNYTIQTKL